MFYICFYRLVRPWSLNVYIYGAEVSTLNQSTSFPHHLVYTVRRTMSGGQGSWKDFGVCNSTRVKGCFCIHSVNMRIVYVNYPPESVIVWYLAQNISLHCPTNPLR